MKDYYEILEVHPKASTEVIKKAYAVLAKKYHPDVTKLEADLAQRRMAEINEAYAVLSDQKKRRQYDYDLVCKKSSQYSQEPQRATKQSAEDLERQRRTSASNERAIHIKNVKSRFIDSCDYYIDTVDKRIIQGDAGAKSVEYCSKLLNQFYKEIQDDYRFLETEHAWDKDTIQNYGVALWWFASAYFECGDLNNTRKTLNMAVNFIGASYPRYNDFKEFKALVDSKVNGSDVENRKNNVEKFEIPDNFICPECGNYINSSMKFCNKCGFKFDWSGMVTKANLDAVRAANKQKGNVEVMYRSDSTTGVYQCPCCGASVTTKDSQCPVCYKQFVWGKERPAQVDTGCASGCAYFCLALVVIFVCIALS